MKHSSAVSQFLVRSLGALVAVIALLGQSALATVYFQDGFNYNNSSRLGTNSPWTYVTTNTGVVIDSTVLPAYSSGGITLQDFFPAGFHVKSTPLSTGNQLTYCTNMIPVTTGNGGFIYCSFTLDMTANMNYQYAFGMLGLFATNSTKTNWVSGVTNAANEAFSLEAWTNGSSSRIGIQVANNTSLLVASNFATVTLNTVHLVIIKYDLTTGMGYLFLDPIPGVAEPGAASAISKVPSTNPTFTGANAQGKFWIESAYNGGGTQIYTPTFHLDSLRVADNWAEVTPAGVVTVFRNLTWQGDGTGNPWDNGITADWLTNAVTSATAFSNYTTTNSDNVLFDDSATNFVVNIASGLLPGSLVVNATNDYVFTNSVTGFIDGASGLVKTNSGKLTIGSSNTFSGAVLVSGGVLQPANLDALGSNATVTVTNGGTLDLNGSQWVGLNYNQTYLSRQISLSGSGYNGLGAVINSSPNPPTGLSGYSENAFSVNVALTGDATLNAAAGPFDIGDQYGGTFAGNGFKLTKTGTNIVSLICNGGTGLGNIEIQQGFLFFTGGGYSGSYSNDMGTAATTLTVDAGAALGLYAPRGTNGGSLNKPWALNSPAEIYTGSGNNTNIASVTLNNVGTNLIYVDNLYFPSSLTLNGVVSGAGSLYKDGANILRLSGTNRYSGNTIIATGTLALGPNGRITNSPLVAIAAGAAFDVSASATGFTFTNNPVQTLACSSTAGNATITAGTGAKAVTLAPNALASFQADGSAGTAGNITVLGALNLNANVITVNVANSALVPGTYQLLNCTNILTGTANTTPIITGIALVAGTTATISTTVGSAGHVDLVVKTMPAFSGLSGTSISYGSGNITLTGTVSTNDPLYPTLGETVAVTINGNTKTTTINDFTGDFSINYNPSTIPASATPYAITFSYSGNATLTGTTDSSVSLTVNKATPLLATPNAGFIAYGQTLAASTLTGGAATNANNNVAVAGSFSFTSPDIAPNAGNTNVDVTFTPTDTVDYNTSTVTVSVTVNKAAPSLTAPAASVITYGQTLAASTLTGGAATNADNNVAVAGSFSFTSPGITPNAGSTNADVTFTPTDVANYNTSITTINVTVNPAATTTLIVSSQNPSSLGGNVDFTVTVSSGVGIPIGTVLFKTNNVAMGVPVALAADGNVTNSTAMLPSGTNTVSVEFVSGDGNYLPSTNSLAQVVNDQSVTGQTQSISVNGNLVTVQFSGTEGHSYDVQRSTNILDWATIWTTNAPVGGQFDYTDAFGDLDAPPASAYYRLSWQP